MLRNRIDDTALLKPLIEGDLVDDPEDHRGRQGPVADVPRAALLRPEPARLAPRIGDHRLRYTDEIAGYRERPDYLAGRRGLQVRDEIRMVRPGFYLGRAYLGKVFLLNFTLYNKEIAERDGEAFVKTGRIKEDCWPGTQQRPTIHRGEVTHAAMRHGEAASLAAIVAACRCSRRPPSSAQTMPAWAIDPAMPGPTLPPAGRSLFDFVTAGRRAVSFRGAGAQGRGTRGLRRRASASTRC